MIRAAPGGGAVGSLGLVEALPPAPGVLRLLGLELRPEPAVVPKLPPGPLPTVGLFGLIAG